MRRYQKTYRIVQSVFISVSVILLLLIVVPILQFQLKSESALTFDLMGSKYNTSGADWVTNYYKMTQESGDPDLLFFRDISVVTEENANLLLGRAAIFDESEMISSLSYFMPLTARYVFRNSVRRCHHDCDLKL